MQEAHGTSSNSFVYNFNDIQRVRGNVALQPRNSSVKMDIPASTRLNKLADSIRTKKPVCEISSMFVDTAPYRQALRDWRETNTGLTMFQLAVSCDYAAVVKLLTEDKHEYMFTWFSETPNRRMNHPLHLACKVGALKTLKYFISSKDDDCLLDTLRSSCAVTYPQKLPVSVTKEKTPFSWCLDGGHLDCAKLLCSFIISHASRSSGGLVELCRGTLLHKASFLGSGSFLSLLLANGHICEINAGDKRGQKPFHVAALYAQPDCLEKLLKYKTNINATAGCKTALHLMYGSKIHPDRFVACTKLLIQHGIDVDMMDLNHNTALDYLAWELGQKQYPDSHLEGYASQFLTADPKETSLSAEDCNMKVITCMELLLQAGASTVVKTPDGHIDHTIVHTLLQNTSWPISSFIVRHPQNLYQALNLLFSFGANPNVIARNNNESAFTMLLVHSLNELERSELKCDLVHLFIINGADLESHVPKPRHFRENWSDRLWDIYPVMLALQECHPVAVLHLMYTFMSLTHVAASLRLIAASWLWHRIKQKLGGSSGSDRSAFSKYKAQWQCLTKSFREVRSLKHICKLSILGELKMRGQLVDLLPFPGAIKQYLISKEC